MNPIRAVLGFLAFCLAISFNVSTAAAQTAEQCSEAWTRARENYSVLDIEKFIKDFPKCPQVAEAVEALELLLSPTLGGQPVRYAPVGRILLPQTPMTAEGGGYGIVLLRASSTRNRQACEAMRRALDFRVEAVDARADLVDGFLLFRRPIYWPVKSRTGDGNWDCNAMLQHYDHERAWLKFQGSSYFEKPGPYIVLVSATGAQAAVFNFSDVPADAFGRVFDAVLLRMSRDSSIWQANYYREASLRERLRRVLGEDSAGVTAVIANLVGLPQAFAAPTR